MTHNVGLPGCCLPGCGPAYCLRCSNFCLPASASLWPRRTADSCRGGRTTCLFWVAL